MELSTNDIDKYMESLIEFLKEFYDREYPGNSLITVWRFLEPVIRNVIQNNKIGYDIKYGIQCLFDDTLTVIKDYYNRIINQTKKCNEHIKKLNILKQISESKSYYIYNISKQFIEDMRTTTESSKYLNLEKYFEYRIFEYDYDPNILILNLTVPEESSIDRIFDSRKQVSIQLLKKEINFNLSQRDDHLETLNKLSEIFRINDIYSDIRLFKPDILQYRRLTDEIIDTSNELKCLLIETQALCDNIILAINKQSLLLNTLLFIQGETFISTYNIFRSLKLDPLDPRYQQYQQYLVFELNQVQLNQ